jgi:lactose/L-arabinose transport system ATP-binding protein
MNFMQGRVENGTLSIPAIGTPLTLDLRLPSDGTGVECGIRPEHLRIDPNGSGFRLDLVEKLGGVSYAYLEARSGERLVVAESGAPDLSDDMDVGLAFDPAQAFLFDAQTGKRIR